MDKNKKITKIIITTISLICVLLAVAVISSGLSIMIYRANTPRVIMKQNVTIKEGESIMRDKLELNAPTEADNKLAADIESHGFDQFLQ